MRRHHAIPREPIMIAGGTGPRRTQEKGEVIMTTQVPEDPLESVSGIVDLGWHDRRGPDPATRRTGRHVITTGAAINHHRVLAGPGSQLAVAGSPARSNTSSSPSADTSRRRLIDQVDRLGRRALPCG